jgi:hypothetical protein
MPRIFRSISDSAASTKNIATMISAAVTAVVAQFRARAPHIGCASPGLSGIDGHRLRTDKIDPRPGL